MPTENIPVEPFLREDRYIVIKRSDMEKLPIDQRRNFAGRCRALHEQMFIAGAPARSVLVIESDWPEYEPVWQMIERRMAGQPPVTAAEELDAVLHWRDKHTQAINERDALQQRLNAADQRIDELTPLHIEHPEGKRERFEKWVMAKMREMMEDPSKVDPRMDPAKNPMPFDGRRLIFGGFVPVVELTA